MLGSSAIRPHHHPTCVWRSGHPEQVEAKRYEPGARNSVVDVSRRPFDAATTPASAPRWARRRPAPRARGVAFYGRAQTSEPSPFAQEYDTDVGNGIRHLASLLAGFAGLLACSQGQEDYAEPAWPTATITVGAPFSATLSAPAEVLNLGDAFEVWITHSPELSTRLDIPGPPAVRTYLPSDASLASVSASTWGALCDATTGLGYGDRGWWTLVISSATASGDGRYYFVHGTLDADLDYYDSTPCASLHAEF